MSWPWSQLGLPGPADLPQIRHAYAEKLKITHPEEDPEGFQQLHAAYQLASRLARRNRNQAGPAPAAAEMPPAKGEAYPDPAFGEDGEREFDFGELLREDSVPLRRDSPGQDWDYDRLLAEGEAERAEARRLRGEERRRTQEGTQRKRGNDSGKARQGQFDWQDTEAVLHTVEMMAGSQAEQEAWKRFFNSPMFRKAKDSLDLVFGLEDFASTRADFSQQARTALFLAYGFDKKAPRAELRPLYQLLLPAWKEEQRNKRRERLNNFAVVLISILTVLVTAVVFTSATLPVFLLMGVLLIVGQNKGWFKGGPKPLNRKRRPYAVVFACALAAALLLPGVWNSIQPLLPTSDPREQVCRYLGEDYGVQVRSLYNKKSPDERFGNVFALEDQPDRMFLVGPDGERDKENGRLGYTTNYPEMKVLWALEDFAEARGITGVKELDRGLGQWETGGVYLIALEFWGDGELITELGDLLEKLALEEWYQVRPPEFEIVLCSGPLEEGRLILFRYKASEGKFDAESVRSLYEKDFAHAYCAQMLREENLARDFIHGGEEPYTLIDGGTAQMKGELCCRLYGLDAGGETAMEYYISTSGGNIYCVPGGFWEAGGTEEDIQFYRLIHRDASGDMFSLFYPWISAVRG